MRKLKIISLTLAALMILVILVFWIVDFFKPKVAGIYIETNPPSTVFINGKEVGHTPYKGLREPGEIILRLIPDSFQRRLSSYETKLNLIAGVETVLKRDFGDLEETSAGEVLSLEKIDKDETSLIVVTIPDAAQLVIDEKDKVITPYKTSLILPGEHTLTISAEGFLERTIRVKTHLGYKLTIVVKLAKVSKPVDEEVSQTPEDLEEKEEKTIKEVEILTTAVGFLRVRDKPSTLGKEVGRVDPGRRYPIVEIDEKTGWYKIEYEEGRFGWISNQYAREVDLTPTPMFESATQE